MFHGGEISSAKAKADAAAYIVAYTTAGVEAPFRLLRG